MFADEIGRAVEAAPRIGLPAVAALLWRAYGAGQVTEAEAEALSARIEERRRGSERVNTLRDAPSDRPGRPRTGTGSGPVSAASLERRRRWAASGRLPPALAARFTLAEQAALALVAAETARRGDCRLAIEHMAALAGISRSTVKNAIRQARKLGLVTVEERPVTAWRNDTNIVRVVSPEWSAWLRLGRKGNRPSPGSRQRPASVSGGGVRTSTGTPTKVPVLLKSRPADPLRRLPGGSGRPRRGG